MSADTRAASARWSAGAVHRPSRTMAEEADVAVLAVPFSAFVRAAADAEARAPVAAADVAATPGEAPQATMPAISTTEPAISARIPIAHPLHSLSCRGPVRRRFR